MLSISFPQHLKNESLLERQTIERENWERERINNSHLLDELSKELEELRAYKFEKEREKNVFRTLSVSDLPLSRFRIFCVIRC